MPEPPTGARGSGGAAARAEQRLVGLLAREQRAPLSPAVRSLAAELRRRHGPAVAAVVFYGSCLRKRTQEGVLDFYVVVDGYRSAHGSWAMAAANAILPPNVFYCEWPFHGETLRTKYAVISLRDLERGASTGPLDGRIWARFCQPIALAYARDEVTRARLAGVAARACRTFVARALPALPDASGLQRFSAEDLFRAGFRETYRSELRSERPAAVRQLFDAFAERHAAVASATLRLLAARGRVEVREADGGFVVRSGRAALGRSRLAAQLRRPPAKALAIAGLLKTAFTFDDWVPYVLWKMERHTAVKIEVTERQRRHPLIFGWPVVLRVLREGLYR